MKVLNRYILRESFIFFAIALFAFTSVLLTVQMLRFTSLIVNKGVGFFQIVQVFISIIPTFLEIAVPMAALLGVMLAFARLSGDSEIVVMRASGISLHQLLKPVFLFGVAILVLSFFVSVFLRPWGYDHLNRTLFQIARSRSIAGLDPGIFSRLGDLTIYAEEINHQSGLLNRLVIDDKRDAESRKIITAKSGRILSDQQNRTITFDLFDGDIHEIIRGNYVLTRFDTNSIIVDSSEILSGDDSQRGRKSQEMSFAELRARINNLKSKLSERGAPPISEESFTEYFSGEARNPAEAEKKISKLIIEGGRRFSIPVASFLLVLLGMPLGVHPPRTQRTWGIGLSSLLGLGVFVVYYGLLSVGMALAEGSTVSPYIALWFPNLIVLGASIFFIRRVASEKWQSVAEGFSEIYGTLREQIGRRIRI